MESLIVKKVLLNNGIEMPLLGLGTSDPRYDIKKPFWIKGKLLNFIYSKIMWLYLGLKFSFTLKHALLSGYRMIDTSSAYKNSLFIRIGIKLSKIKREDLFIITRISNQEQWKSSVEESVSKSLKELNIDYIDLFMFHWPVPGEFISTWKEMENLYKQGLLKSIGLANCHQNHIEEIEKIATVQPSVNEIEIHPLLNQEKLISYCLSKNILPIAYTPLGRMHFKIVNNEYLKELSRNYNKSIGQIILRWHFQKGIPAIPRSMNKSNLEKNIDIFDFNLSFREIEQINLINENLRLRHNPDNCDFTKL